MESIQKIKFVVNCCFPIVEWHKNNAKLIRSEPSYFRETGVALKERVKGWVIVAQMEM